ncbi:MAG: hypothetical protein COA36_16285 [Desulfotalea sp.]|nr:MAG: hypothetical protein COA36_16285 [Desulfotalea sp.]
MNYTSANDTNINQKIESDLGYIKDRVAALLGDKLHSLLLCGSFGRGEGSVVVRNNTIHIVNDYDFTVVLNSGNPLHYLYIYRKIHTSLEKLAVQLAEELDIKQVDLSPKPLYYFSSQQQLKIENYEIKTGHALLLGELNPTIYMPDWRVSDIPLFEGTWLLRNRGTGMVLAAIYFLVNNEVPEEKRENFIIECTKAQLAMGDAILLIKKSYHHLYHRRSTLINELDLSDIPAGEEIRKQYNEAIKQKLRPDFSRYAQRNLKQWWFDLNKYFAYFFTSYEQRRLQNKFANWQDYTAISKPEDHLDLKSFAAQLIKRPNTGISFKSIAADYRRSKKSFTISLVALLLFSLTEQGIDSTMIKKAAAMLNIPLAGTAKENWLLLAKTILNEIHPGGEVGKTLKTIQFP